MKEKVSIYAIDAANGFTHIGLDYIGNSWREEKRPIILKHHTVKRTAELMEGNYQILAKAAYDFAKKKKELNPSFKKVWPVSLEQIGEDYLES